MTGDVILFALILLGLVSMLVWSWRQDPVSFPPDPHACKECGRRKPKPKRCKECGEEIVDDCLF
jgi:hypothetical protein